MAFHFVVTVTVLACLVMVKDGDFLERGGDETIMHEVGPYVGGGEFNRGIGESLSGGILGGGMMDSGFGMSHKYAGSPRIGGGIGGIQRGISGGILGSGRGQFGKFRGGRVSAGLAGFARRPRRVVGMGGILGARRRSWKMY
ncbi:acanthoscurrin-2-like [Mercenaria mercenaria]|uniref:acanthoscurrin-2-like n=1 Tax=Mercenaria mercenaria TaxID=6596 RepID=UPI00234E99D2|nr:acanthoscurrin-2-like [Mercenaria mercenaria]